MNDSDWEIRAMDIAAEALEHPPSARGAFLDEACRLNEALRTEVESLLRFEKPARGFIARAAVEVHPQAVLDAPSLAPEASLSPGHLLGHFRVRSLLGEGGMGEVYLAEDPELNRLVAIKLVKRSIASAASQRFFGQEKRILAGLNDVYIARLYSGAVAADGRPYLVMEYVDGELLDVYCRERRLPLAGRLEIFRKVCAGVSHAHQHLVIHRDLKPANIRVTPAGEPKLLDFGIAKLIEPEGTANAGNVVTLSGAMTPEYASPEQLRGEPVTTASDVYSLGVVLYELLTGQRAYHFAGSRPDQLTRAICEQDPPRPSTVAGSRPSATEGAGDGEPPGKLRRLLAGDLDNIVAMAMRKEPARRYASVAQLSEDIRRHGAGLPVFARKETLRYVGAKFVLRNRAFAAAALLGVLALVGGIAATGWQAHQANVQRRLADAQRQLADAQRLKAEQRFEDVRHLADSLMGEIHDSVQDLAGATPTRKLIVSRALEYLDNLSRDADTPVLRLDLAAAYRKIGDVQGNPYGSNLGDMGGALASYRKAETLLTPLPDAATGETRAVRVELGRVERALGDMGQFRGDFAEMMRRYHRSLEIFAQLEREQPSDPMALDELARADDTLGDGLSRTENGDAEQTTCYAQALAERQKLVAQFPGNVKYRRGLAVAFLKLGRTTKSDPAHGVADIRRGVDMMKALAEENPDSAGLRSAYVVLLYELGVAQTETGDHTGALASFTQVLPIRERLLATDPKDNQAHYNVAATHGQLAEALTNTGQPEQALEHGRQAISGLDALMVADPGNILYIRNSVVVRRQVAAAHVALATRESLDKGARTAHWSEARLAYEQARERFDALKTKGGVRTEDADMLDRLAAATAKCDQGLARLKDE